MALGALLLILIGLGKCRAARHARIWEAPTSIFYPAPCPGARAKPDQQATHFCRAAKMMHASAMLHNWLDEKPVITAFCKFSQSIPRLATNQQKNQQN
jgi:hypothetical protein